jgi:hypothetical protein
MAIGDSVTNHSSILNGAFLTIQPGAGAEWLITNVYANGAFELYRTDGTNLIFLDATIAQGSFQNRKMIATYTIYFAIKNISGGTIYMGYDGFVIK